MLASGAEAVEPHALRRRYVTALGWGAFGVTLMMALWLGVRPDMVKAAALPMFWMKLAYPGVLLAGALLAVLRLSRPGAQLGPAPLVMAAPVLAMWLMAAWILIQAAPGARDDLVFGDSWSACPVYIATLSVPAFMAVMWAMKGLAPTRPVVAGAAAGLVSGSMGALVYALHCPEMAAPFLGIWYLLGMLIPAVTGGVLGRWLLRW